MFETKQLKENKTNPNFHGKKGRSGRPSNYQRAQNGNLLEVCTEWLIENFHTFDKATKLRVALTIAPKGIVQQVDQKITMSFSLTDAWQETQQIREQVVKPSIN